MSEILAGPKLRERKLAARTSTTATMARTNKMKSSEKARPSEKDSKKSKPMEPETASDEEEEQDVDDGYSSPSVLETGDADGGDIGSDLDGEDEEEESSVRTLSFSSTLHTQDSMLILDSLMRNSRMMR